MSGSLGTKEDRGSERSGAHRGTVGMKANRENLGYFKSIQVNRGGEKVFRSRFGGVPRKGNTREFMETVGDPVVDEE